MKSLYPGGSPQNIENCILMIRGLRVILDADLAEFYGVSTKRLNEQVKRNLARFPEDFSFYLTPEEKAEVVANCDHLNKLKYNKMLPRAFTEHGAIMASNVINSPRAVEMGVFVVRAFVQLRASLLSHKEISAQVNRLEKRLVGQDEQIQSIVRALRILLDKKAVPEKRRIGF